MSSAAFALKGALPHSFWEASNRQIFLDFDSPMSRFPHTECFHSLELERLKSSTDSRTDVALITEHAVAAIAVPASELALRAWASSGLERFTQRGVERDELPAWTEQALAEAHEMLLREGLEQEAELRHGSLAVYCGATRSTRNVRHAALRVFSRVANAGKYVAFRRSAGESTGRVLDSEHKVELTYHSQTKASFLLRQLERKSDAALLYVRCPGALDESGAGLDVRLLAKHGDQLQMSRAANDGELWLQRLKRRVQ